MPQKKTRSAKPKSATPASRKPVSGNSGFGESELLVLSRRYLYFGQFRSYAMILYTGMRYEFYHCRLIFGVWRDATLGLLEATSPWFTVLRAGEPLGVSEADKTMVTVRQLIKKALDELEKGGKVEGDIDRAVTNPRSGSESEPHDTGTKHLKNYVTALANAAGHLRKIVKELADMQIKMQTMYGGSGVQSVDAFLERSKKVPGYLDLSKTSLIIPPAVEKILSAEDKRDLEEDAATAALYSTAPLTAVLRSLRDLIQDRMPLLPREYLLPIQALAMENRSLPRYFLLCLKTREAVQLAFKAALFKPVDLDGHLLARLHDAIDSAAEIVVAGPPALSVSIERRKEFLAKCLPNRTDKWLKNYLAYVVDPTSSGSESNQKQLDEIAADLDKSKISRDITQVTSLENRALQELKSCVYDRESAIVKHTADTVMVILAGEKSKEVTLAGEKRNPGPSKEVVEHLKKNYSWKSDTGSPATFQYKYESV